MNFFKGQTNVRRCSKTINRSNGLHHSRLVTMVKDDRRVCMNGEQNKTKNLKIESEKKNELR